MDYLFLGLASLALLGAVMALTISLTDWVGGETSRRVADREAENQAALEDLFLTGVTPRQVTAFTFAAAIALATIVLFGTGSIFFALVIGIGVLFVPAALFAYLRKERLQKFDDQLPDALGILANSTRAGLSLIQAIEEVAEQAQPPISQEMSLILQDVRLGSDLGKSLDDARQRLTRNFGLVATALNVNREKGGNLPEALDSMSNSLQEIWRLDQKLLTASAEGRKAMWVIAGMPLFVFGIVGLTQPDIPATLTGSFIGLVILAIGGALYATGFFWLLQVLKRDV